MPISGKSLSGQFRLPALETLQYVPGRHLQDSMTENRRETSISRWLNEGTGPRLGPAGTNSSLRTGFWLWRVGLNSHKRTDSGRGSVGWTMTCKSDCAGRELLRTSTRLANGDSYAESEDMRSQRGSSMQVPNFRWILPKAVDVGPLLQKSSGSRNRLAELRS